MSAAPSPRFQTGRAALAIAVVLLALVGAGCSKDKGSDGANAVAMGSGSSTTQPALSTSTSSSTTTSTTSPVPTVPPPTGNTKADFVTAIAQTLRRSVPALLVPDSQVECVAAISLDAIGMDAFTSRGLTAAQVANPSFEFAQLGMTRVVAEAVVDAYKTCGVDTRALVLATVAAVVKPPQAACIGGRVDDQLAHDVLVELVQFGTYSPQTSVKIRAIARACGVKAN